MRALLLISILAACGDDVEPWAEHSGTRLTLMYASDVAGEAEGILDTDLAVECAFQVEDHGSYTCVPGDAAPSARFVHAWSAWQAAETRIVPMFLIADDGLVVRHAFHDTAGDFDCAFDAAGSCQPFAPRR